MADLKPPVFITYRDKLLQLVPRWLQTGLAQKLLYALGVHMDLLVDMANAAVRRRLVALPESADALALSGRERRIRRGRIEPDESYAERLIPWLDDHKIRGNPHALLNQYWAFRASSIDPPVLVDGSGNVLLDALGNPLLGDRPPIALLYETGARFIRYADGTIVRDIIAPFDTNTAFWARWFLVIQWPDPLTNDGTWGDPGTWEDGGVWDSGLSANDVEDLRLVPAEWNAAHAVGYVVLLSPGIELWDTPAGTWADPGVWGDDANATVTIAVE